jgi:hypothetical protein
MVSVKQSFALDTWNNLTRLEVSWRVEIQFLTLNVWLLIFEAAMNMMPRSRRMRQRRSMMCCCDCCCRGSCCSACPKCHKYSPGEGCATYRQSLLECRVCIRKSTEPELSYKIITTQIITHITPATCILTERWRGTAGHRLASRQLCGCAQTQP